MLYRHLILLFLQSLGRASALDMDTSSKDSINSGLAKIAKGVMDYYNGHEPGNTIGMFEPPYYWWESGAAWGSILDYWYFTGDTTYNEKLYDSLLWQAGENYTYLPQNQTMTEGNDDQGYWGITLMGAAERGFKDPTAGTPSWSKRVENIVDTMISRWDTSNCDGGLRWQIYSWNKGYDYKNTVSNGCLFHLSARLSHFNNDDKYIEWAEKTWDWLESHNYVLTNISAWKVFDGASISNGCTELSPEQWTYNAGLLLSGSAYMYDYTKDTKWLDRAKHLWEGCAVFFKDHRTMYEASCQISNRCNNDQRSFKAYFSRFLGLTSMLVPDISDSIMKSLQLTVPGVLSSCSGGSDGHTCGIDWSKGSWDGVYGLGEQMSSLELIQNALLVKQRPGPANQNNEGSLEGSMDNGISGAPAVASSAHSFEPNSKTGSPTQAFSELSAKSSSQTTFATANSQNVQETHTASGNPVPDSNIGSSSNDAENSPTATNPDIMSTVPIFKSSEPGFNTPVSEPHNYPSSLASPNSFFDGPASQPSALTTVVIKPAVTHSVPPPVTVYDISTTHIVLTVTSSQTGAAHTTVTVYTDPAGSIVATATGSNFKPPVVTVSKHETVTIESEYPAESPSSVPEPVSSDNTGNLLLEKPTASISVKYLTYNPNFEKSNTLSIKPVIMFQPNQATPIANENQNTQVPAAFGTVDPIVQIVESRTLTEYHTVSVVSSVTDSPENVYL